jgi:hypothetical protein
MTVIYVTNRSDKKLKDGLGGVFYTFPKDTTVEIPEEVARHIFGYGIEDKEVYLARLGWCRTSNDLEDALKILDQWEISTQPPKKDQSLSPLVEKVPLPAKRQVRGNILKIAS